MAHGEQIGVTFVAYLLLMAVTALLLLRRLLKSVRAQRLKALDVKQAQEVQQVILPEACTTLPGMVIESEMIEGAEFSVMRFTLAAGDKLVLVSDGLAEATDAHGQLFGFERVHELMRKGKSASEVAGARRSSGRKTTLASSQ